MKRKIILICAVTSENVLRKLAEKDRKSIRKNLSRVRTALNLPQLGEKKPNVKEYVT